MLPPALKLLIYLPKGTLKTPWIDREVGTRVPHLAHSLSKRHHEFTVVTHDIIRIDLVLVGRMLSIANLAHFLVILIICDACEEVTNIR